MSDPLAATEEAPSLLSIPLKDIAAPHAHDVLCGRGGGTNAHVGNNHWRMLVAANKELYVSLPKRQKQLLSKSIVHAVRSQNPPGRFLQKSANAELWYDVGDRRAAEKTSQALREGAPDIRKKVKTEGVVVAPKLPPITTAAASASMVAPPLPPTIVAQGPVLNRKKNYKKVANVDAKESETVPIYEKDDVATKKHTINDTTAAREVMGEPIAEPTILDADQIFSLGSIQMSDVEQYNLMLAIQQSAHPYQYNHPISSYPSIQPPEGGLEPAGLSVGSMMSIATATYGEEKSDYNNENNKDQPYNYYPNFNNNRQPPLPIIAPVDGGLEPTGFSFGSAMSINSTDIAKLETAGLSIGSLMSVTAPSGGLEQIGTSFGSMSLSKQSPPTASAAIAVAETILNGDSASAPPLSETTFIPTTQLKVHCSQGNLLDCSDTESENEDEKRQISERKSQDWVKLQETLAAQTSVQRTTTPNGSAGHADDNHSNSRPMDLHIPTAPHWNDRDFSAISVDDFHPNVMPTARMLPSENVDMVVPPPPLNPIHGLEYTATPPINNYTNNRTMAPPPLRKNVGDSNEEEDL
jgi:hypothetical protein